MKPTYAVWLYLRGVRDGEIVDPDRAGMIIFEMMSLTLQCCEHETFKSLRIYVPIAIHGTTQANRGPGGDIGKAKR